MPLSRLSALMCSSGHVVLDWAKKACRSSVVVVKVVVAAAAALLLHKPQSSFRWHLGHVDLAHRMQEKRTLACVSMLQLQQVELSNSFLLVVVSSSLKWSPESIASLYARTSLGVDRRVDCRNGCFVRKMLGWKFECSENLGEGNDSNDSMESKECRDSVKDSVESLTA